jgi:hypothetical protein
MVFQINHNLIGNLKGASDSLEAIRNSGSAPEER